MKAPPTFLTASKHLFRHLCDADALRKNPLVARFFGDRAAGLNRVQDDREALARIHRLVGEGARSCREADLAAGRHERARRHYTIAILQLLERRTIHEVAARLGISSQQCYRERADVSRRIAHYISLQLERAVQYLPNLDAFGLLMETTRRGAAYREAGAALRQCDDLVSAAPSPERKVEALRIRALVALGFGDASRADDSLAAARRCAQQLTGGSPRDLEIARACVDLLECDLAFSRAESGEALRSAKNAARRLERLQANASAHVRDLYAESLYELGAAFWNAGDLEGAHGSLVRAHANLDGRPAAPAQLRARVAVGVWKSRNHLIMSSKSWSPLPERVAGLAAAFEAAYAAGLLVEATDALVALVQSHAFAGDDAAALRAARFAAVLARQHSSSRVRTQTFIQVAMALLWSKHWERGLALFDEDGAQACDGYHRDVAEYFRAERALRRNAWSEAWSLARGAYESSPYPALAVRRQLIAAAAAHGLRRAREARSLIETAVPAAERLGSAPILRDAYDFAARIMGQPRFRRKAVELSHLLSA